MTAPTNTSPVLRWTVRCVREESKARYTTLPDATEGEGDAAGAERRGEERSIGERRRKRGSGEAQGSMVEREEERREEKVGCRSDEESTSKEHHDCGERNIDLTTRSLPHPYHHMSFI